MILDTRPLPLFPSARTHSSDTLCSMDSLSDDGHGIVINIPSSPIPVTITAPDETIPLKNGIIKNASQHQSEVV